MTFINIFYFFFTCGKKYFERYKTEFLLDTQFLSYGTPEDPRKAIHFGPQFMSSKLYQNCSAAVITVLHFFKFNLDYLISYVEELMYIYCCSGSRISPHVDQTKFIIH